MRKNTYEKYQGYIGTKINNWEILDIVRNESLNRTHVIAKCHCGNIKTVRLTCIVNNRTIDCGCGHKQRIETAAIQKYEYLVGNQIHGWLVQRILPPDDQHRNTYAICKCKCGAIKDVNVHNLISGRSKDCGCGRKLTVSAMMQKNLIGERFGKLVVVERLSQKNKNKKTIYRCKCDCGNSIDVLGNSLVTHHTLSCGCLISYGNMRIAQILEANKINFKPEYTVHIDERYYRFDFYLPEYNLFIEYDGQQHFKPTRFRGPHFINGEEIHERCRKSDAIKNQYCKNNNVNLLRIPYWEQDNIETIINDHLQRLSEKGFTEKAS